MAASPSSATSIQGFVPQPGAYIVLYDGQCEVCQACVSWLHVLEGDRKRTEPVPIDAALLPQIHPDLRLEDCLRQLHVVTPAGKLLVGWEAVAALARLFRTTWLLGALGSAPGLRWVADAAYRFVARNRYALSKCRGGACSVAHPQQVRRQSSLSAFWSCYTLGMLMRGPLIVFVALRDAWRRLRTYLRTRHRRFDFLGGKLRLLVLNGFFPDLVPMVFGELFTAIWYDGVLVDPGSPKMRSSLRRQLRRLAEPVRCVVATHHHEEHVGNLAWAAETCGCPLLVPPETAALLREGLRLPWARRTIIGAPPPLKDSTPLADRVRGASTELVVVQTPGHCDDHVALYDPREKLLLAGDCFMGSYFSAPNADVDSRKWIETLERLLALDIEILVEGHGQIHTLRPDIADFPGVVFRHDPKQAIAEKLQFMRWVRDQVEAGFREGLPPRAIEATCFPWGRRTAWESFANDQVVAALSLGHFSRAELVRSFVRNNDAVLPLVYRARILS